MTIAGQKRRERADIVAECQREGQALARLQIEKAKIASVASRLSLRGFAFTLRMRIRQTTSTSGEM